jgi:hypothetical protein
MVVDLALDGDTLFPTTTRMVTEGMPYYTLYGPKWAGVDPETGVNTWYMRDGTISKTYKSTEKFYIGTTDPKAYGGFNTKVTAYGFDFLAQFYYSLGGLTYNNSADTWEVSGKNYKNVPYYLFDTRWKEPGDIAQSAKISTGVVSNYASTQFITSKNHLRCQNLTLGYTIPKDISAKLTLTKARIYVSVDNAFTWYHKDLRELEPESGLNQSVNTNTMTPGRNILAGIQVSF